MNLTKLLGIFDILPGWMWAAILALVMLGAGVEFGALQARNAALRVELALAQGKVAAEVAGRAKDREAYQLERTKAVAAALEVAGQERDELLRQIKAQQGAQDDFNKQIAAARADAVRADRAADGLRDQLSWYVDAAKRQAGAASSAGQQCAPAGAALDVLADLFRGADSVAGILARAFDAARAAGLNCQARYDALMPASSGKTP